MGISRFSVLGFMIIVVSLIQMTHLLLAASPNSKPLIRLDKGVVPTHYSIDLTVDPKKNDFDGTVKIELELASRMETIVLHSAQLTFDKIEVQSGETKQTATPQLLSDDGTIELHFVNADRKSVV